jgi:hypothetical protein
MIFYRGALAIALAVCVILPISASAKEHRSTSVKREFQLTHPCPATGLTSGPCPGYVKDHVLPLGCAVLILSLTDSGRRSAMQRQRINGRRRAACDQGSYCRAVPVTTKSTSRAPHSEQTSLSRQSRTLVSAPYRAPISAGSGST